MKPRVHKINAHRSFAYYTPEDVERIVAEHVAAALAAAPQPQPQRQAASSQTKLSERVRPDCEVARYVYDEIVALENALAAALNAAPQPQAEP